MAELILGIDEAGRGPVIGPIVVAGVLIDSKSERQLKNLGIKDSKQLTQKRREILSEKIKDNSESFEIILSSPKEIDEKLKNKTNLNLLEAEKIAEIINRTNKGFKKIKVVIDCPSISIEKWKDILKTKIKNLKNLEIVCEHKADKNHVSVSAASILAKCIREEEMSKLKEKYGPEIGSGYTSDPATISFIKKHASKHRKEGIFRETWETWKKAFEKITQRTIG